ncbi:TonB-dependent receptor domain-containing protein [Olivibacter domesticus]|uniref:Outer membrane receptor for ferrienterochelin and colicins n=1 Tax=Olivibacter domesticus TaxID=407022 RepID=A0A1H7R0L7_OLID1|nr:TonB-dependent receptor [Olivibacter domesticus]SEL53107.1 Outer membrane receptor for ferrienterochelin and colicins [Olivibacter domesticus]
MKISHLKNLLFLLFITTNALAQPTTVEGTIYDEITSTPISYASVTIHQKKDATLVNGVITNKQGKFSFPKLSAGNYILQIKFMGYETKKIDLKPFTAGQKLNLGRIDINPSANFLNEVNIVSKQNPSYNVIDKQVYKAGQFESAKGGTAVDVIKNMPSVSVDGQGEISVRGSKGFLVLINGKPVQTDAYTILSQLPANTIENIELITAPSAKYDPDGKGGIINITTKKGADNGTSLVVNIQGGLPSFEDYNNKESQKRYGTDLTFNYKNDYWDLTASANYLRNDNAGLREGDVYTIINNIKTTFPSNGERSFDKYNYGGRFNVGFSPDKRNTFSLGFFAGHKFQDRLADIYYDNTKIDLSTGQAIGKKQYFNSNLQNKQGDFILGNFNYTHSFNKKSNLALSVLYEYADLFGSTINKNIEAENVVQHTVNTYKNPLNGFRANLDYTLEIGKGKLESGYQFRQDSQDGNFIYSVAEQSEDFEIDPEFSGLVKAKNTIHSLYSQYAGKHKKLEYAAGMRYEYAYREVMISSDPDSHTLELNNLFPSANVLYTLDKGWKTKAGLSRRIQRTNNFELNPIPEREHSETLEQGDADLLPEYIYLMELGLIKSFKQGSFFTTLYFQDIKNPIQRVNSVYADTILNRIFTNAGKAHRYGIETGTNLQATKWWQLYLGANLYKYDIKGTLFDNTVNVENSDWVYSINFNTDFQLNSTLNIQGNVNYLSARPTAQGRDSRFLSPNLSIKKTFMNGRLSALLQWQNMDMGLFNANEQRITTFGADFYTTTNYIYEKDVIMLNLSFNLNNLTRKLKLPESEFGTREF